MTPLYTVVVIILSILAVAGLVVGVSNDAVNFLNSALGSRAASKRVIFSVASVGILVGALTSSGMMEVARNGMFHPGLFTFREVMMLYLGVMFANVILLDLFNTMGLPTSTTVSLIFCLLGSAIAVTTAKIGADPSLTMSDLGRFINTGRTMGIVSAILLSVVLAFALGSMVMYLSRLIFTFRYHRIFRHWGAPWCGVSITVILYFALFKGLQAPLGGTPFMQWISAHQGLAIPLAWAASTLILWGLQRFRVNLLRVTILAGTFSLALAFAGNDLVNFIGVPVAGLDSFRMASAADNPNLLMEGLNASVPANFGILAAAGLLMIFTLWTSKKAMHVTETEIGLASQNEGEERFGSSLFSRTIVRSSLTLNTVLSRILPQRVRAFIDSRFVPLPAEERSGASYDMIRATVNLTTASMLISVATSFQLPLSTTYVTFMVAMGTSLADRAWGRESAVYRITGVLTVVVGWFVTGFAAFLIAYLVGLALSYGQTIAVVLITLLSAYMIVHSNLQARRKRKERAAAPATVHVADVLQECVNEVCDTMERVTRIYDRTLIAVFKENRKVLRDMVRESNELFYKSRERKYQVLPTLQKLHEGDIDTAHYYVQVVDYLSEVTKALVHITRPAYDHIDNNHEGMTREQIEDLMHINDEVEGIYRRINTMLRQNDFRDIELVLEMRDRLFESIAEAIKTELRRIKERTTHTKASMLYLTILGETKTMVLQSRNLLKSQRYFLDHRHEAEAG